MGPEGTGILYARQDCAQRLKPHRAGWLSHKEPTRFLFEGPGLLRYDKPIRSAINFVESGTQNAIGYAGLELSIECLAQLTIPAIFAHVTHWLDALEPRLIERGFTSARLSDPQRQSGILSVRPPHGHSVNEIATALSRAKIICSTPDGWLRFAPHWPNHSDEIPRIIDVVDAALTIH